MWQRMTKSTILSINGQNCAKTHTQNALAKLRRIYQINFSRDSNFWAILFQDAVSEHEKKGQITLFKLQSISILAMLSNRRN